MPDAWEPEFCIDGVDGGAADSQISKIEELVIPSCKCFQGRRGGCAGTIIGNRFRISRFILSLVRAISVDGES